MFFFTWQEFDTNFGTREKRSQQKKSEKPSKGTKRRATIEKSNLKDSGIQRRSTRSSQRQIEEVSYREEPSVEDKEEEKYYSEEAQQQIQKQKAGVGMKRERESSFEKEHSQGKRKNVEPENNSEEEKEEGEISSGGEGTAKESKYHGSKWCEEQMKTQQKTLDNLKALQEMSDLPKAKVRHWFLIIVSVHLHNITYQILHKVKKYLRLIGGEIDAIMRQILLTEEDKQSEFALVTFSIYFFVKKKKCGQSFGIMLRHTHIYLERSWLGYMKNSNTRRMIMRKKRFLAATKAIEKPATLMMLGTKDGRGHPKDLGAVSRNIRKKTASSFHLRWICLQFTLFVFSIPNKYESVPRFTCSTRHLYA